MFLAKYSENGNNQIPWQSSLNFYSTFIFFNILRKHIFAKLSMVKVCIGLPLNCVVWSYGPLQWFCPIFYNFSSKQVYFMSMQTNIWR